MNKDYAYPTLFAHLITTTYGTRGKEWLEKLPTLIEQCTHHWQLTALTAYENLTYGYVLSGMRDKQPIVLKLHCDEAVFQQEKIALQIFARHGCIELLDTNPQWYALLLERALPGTALATYFPDNDTAAIAIASSVLQQLHNAPITATNTFKTLRELLPNFMFDHQLLAPFQSQAQTLKEELLSSITKQVIVHGDFHYDNILAHNGTWITIDPHGAIGDPVFDLAVCIRHPLTHLLEHPHPEAVIVNRIKKYGKHLQWDPRRIYEWTFVQTYAAAQWKIEDGLDPHRHLSFLQLLCKVETTL